MPEKPRITRVEAAVKRLADAIAYEQSLEGRGEASYHHATLVGEARVARQRAEEALIEAQIPAIPNGAKEFVDTFLSSLGEVDRSIHVRIDPSWGPTKEDSVYVNFINLPRGVGSAGGGAEGENNRMSFHVEGFGPADSPPPSGKVKVEMRVSSLPRERKLRAKSGPPAAIAKYLANFLRTIVREVPPRFTHSR